MTLSTVATTVVVVIITTSIEPIYTHHLIFDSQYLIHLISSSPESGATC